MANHRQALRSRGEGRFHDRPLTPKAVAAESNWWRPGIYLLRELRPETPAAIVHAAYRERQAVRLTTLDELAGCEIGMLSTILIGNRSTRFKAGLMITPRGYTHKYVGLTPGRSQRGSVPAAR